MSFEDTKAVINVIMKGRSPTMRHVSGTHRVALDWLFDRINFRHKIQVRNIDTKHQLADMLAKRNFTRNERNNILRLFNVSHFSSICCTKNFSLISCSTWRRRYKVKKKKELCPSRDLQRWIYLLLLRQSSSSASSPVASKSLAMPIASEPDSGVRRNSKSDAASSSGNLVMWIFPDLNPGVFMKRKWRGDLLLTKQPKGNFEHPANQKTREIPKLKKRMATQSTHFFQPQCLTRMQSSRSLGKSTNEIPRTQVRTWTRTRLFGHILEYHSSSNSSSWSRLWCEFKIRQESSVEFFWKKVFNETKKLIRDDRLAFCAAGLIRSPMLKPNSSPIQCFVRERWEMIRVQLGRTKLNGIQRILTSRNWIASTACRRSSSGKYFQDSRRWTSSKRFKNLWKIYSVSLCSSKTGSSYVNVQRHWLERKRKHRKVFSGFYYTCEVRSQMPSRSLVFLGTWIRKEIVRGLFW